MKIETGGWSGEGTFTPVLVAALEHFDTIAELRVEDAPASRVDAGYALIANEIFVRFRLDAREEAVKRLGFLPGRRYIDVPAMTLAGLAEALAGIEGVGAPDYTDEGMLQYLRTERIVPPYQTRGIKVVELIRVYDVAAQPRD
jgi:hypothetical protein